MSQGSVSAISCGLQSGAVTALTCQTAPVQTWLYFLFDTIGFDSSVSVAGATSEEADVLDPTGTTMPDAGPDGSGGGSPGSGGPFDPQDRSGGSIGGGVTDFTGVGGYTDVTII